MANFGCKLNIQGLIPIAIDDPDEGPISEPNVLTQSSPESKVSPRASDAFQEQQKANKNEDQRENECDA